VFAKNVGATDRDFRLVVGAVLMYLAVFVIPGVWGFVVGGVALVMFVTAATGSCPLYSIFGYSTCATKAGGKHS
jgi:hypothetical protein